jgi:ABC-2 type transport system ATP-binding protein
VQSNTEAPTSAVEISGLRVRYGEIEAVSGIDLTIERSAVVALLGPNGAGKSTTINCLIGLKRPHQGQVSVAGSSPREAVRRGRVGAMLQISGLPSGAKVREVIALACSLHRQRGSSAEELLSSAGLEDIAGRAVTKLSGGQAQRVRFAMALAGDPEFLFLDEPTVGMDVESREVFWREVERLAAAGRTILFATHYLEAERFASRVVMLARGRIVADGTPLDLRSRYQPERVVQLISREVERLRSLDLPGLTALDAENDAVRIRTTDADGTMRALYASGIEIRDVTVETSRLDDVFLKLAQAEEEQ